MHSRKDDFVSPPLSLSLSLSLQALLKSFEIIGRTMGYFYGANAVSKSNSVIYNKENIRLFY